MRMNKQSIRYKLNKRGFTLLEIIISSVLITVGIVSVVRVISSGLVFNSSMDGESVALALAQQKMEVLRNTAYTSISDSSTLCSATYTTWAAADITPYYQCWSVTDNTHYKTVVVKIAWDFKGAQRTVSLTTYIANLYPRM